jgi:tetratricopeptide (TPR) repeat protein
MKGDDKTLAIVGEPGCGKSALLTEAARMAREAALEVISSGPDPSMACQPWYPVRGVINQILGFDGEDLDALRRRVGEADLAPEDTFGLSQLFGFRSTGELPEYAVRLRETISSARRVLISSRASRKGLCVMFDDADEFDGASRDFLRSLCAAVSDCGEPVKVIITAESKVPGEGAVDRVIRPGPITRRGAEQLARAIVPARGDSWTRLSEKVIDEARGNALHLVHAFRLLSEGGSEVDATQPDLLGIRIGRLPAPALRLLQIVCTVGLAADREAVKALYRNGDPWEDAITLLVRRGFLLPDTDGQLIVAHAVVAETVREQMPANARRALHRRIVELTEHPVTDPIALARHAYEARMGDVALDIVENAAFLAEECLDDAGAALYFRRALHIARWQLFLEPDDQRCLELSLKLVDSMRYSQDTLGVEMILRESLLAAARNPNLHTQLLRSMARFEMARSRIDEALRAAQEAVGRAFATGSPQLLAETYLDLSRVLSKLGDLKGAADELEEGVRTAVGGAGPTAPPTGMWRLYYELAELRRQQKDPDVAAEAARRALDSASEEGSTLGEARARYLLGAILDAAGDHETAADHFNLALQSFAVLGDRRSIGECLLALAGGASREDDRRKAERALDMFQQISWNEGIKAANRLPSIRPTFH